MPRFPGNPRNRRMTKDEKFLSLCKVVDSLQRTVFAVEALIAAEPYTTWGARASDFLGALRINLDTAGKEAGAEMLRIVRD